MRTFCLLLILANALYFTWAHVLNVQVDVLESPPSKAATPPPRIVLAREAADAQPESTVPLPGTIKDVQPPAVEPLPSSEDPASPDVESPEPSMQTPMASATASSPASDGPDPVAIPGPRPSPAPDRSPQESAAAAGQATARADPLSCTSIGPFADLPQAAQAQAALQSAGFEPRQRVEQGEIWVGHWVSVQGLASREAAEDALETLAANGVTDVYLMPGTEAEPAHVLSLGVFSDYQRAQRRANAVRALGLEPRIDDRKRPGSVYWIDVDLVEPGQFVDSSIFQTDPGKITRLEIRACPAAGQG